MKVIFLDIDGVLNSHYTFPQHRTPNGYTGIEEKYVKLLKEIVDWTGADIVLTSDWKEGWDPVRDNCLLEGQYLTDKLATQQLQIFDKTRDHSYGKGLIGRGKGIKDYLSKHNVKSYVILDDNYFRDFDEELVSHFIQTNDFYGLTENDVAKAIKILNEV